MLKIVEVSCPAKINLFLNVTGFNEEKKLHSVKMINQTIDLYDNITLQETKVGNGITVKSNNIILSNNICYEAAKLFFEYTKIKPNNFLITIQKKIPDNSGLGGKSTDAAGVLLGLNEYYHTNLTKRELIFLASLLGQDVPYFIYSGCKIITGYGDRIETYSKSPYQRFLVIKPDFELKQEDMISQIDKNNLNEKNISVKLLSNDFSSVMPEETTRLKEFLSKYPDLNYSLSGTGPSYFIAFPEKHIKSTMKIILKKEFPNYKLYDAKKSDGHKLLIRYSAKRS